MLKEQFALGLVTGRGLDAISAYEAGATQLGDDRQLQSAASAGRALVTRNVRDFVMLAAEWIARGQSHSGMILLPRAFRGNEYGAIADAVERIAKAHPGGLGAGVVYARRA